MLTGDKQLANELFNIDFLGYLDKEVAPPWIPKRHRQPSANKRHNTHRALELLTKRRIAVPRASRRGTRRVRRHARHTQRLGHRVEVFTESQRRCLCSNRAAARLQEFP